MSLIKMHLKREKGYVSLVIRSSQFNNKCLDKHLIILYGEDGNFSKVELEAPDEVHTGPKMLLRDC